MASAALYCVGEMMGGGISGIEGLSKRLKFVGRTKEDAQSPRF
jgi:hypothetical protein